MDIVTHGMMGIALAGPVLATHPAGAAGFMLGSLLPDLDSFSRCFGKRAFLQWHQGITHSFPVIAAAGVSFYLASWSVAPEIVEAGGGLCLGAALHAFLDLTNTYGVRALAPFSARRFCWEWLFFIDSVVILLTVPAAIFAAMTLGTLNPIGQQVAYGYAGCLLAYLAARGVLRRIARMRCPKNVVSMIPSALWPWEYFVCSRDGDMARIAKLNALTGRQPQIAAHPIYDSQIRSKLESIPEFQAMSALSPAYHVVEFEPTPETTRIRCRDLRIVNFNTSFGMLDIVLGSDSKPISIQLHV
jgi:membrane-bound metal-dependent hydrolase YbcI (DUF457 family)